MILFSVAVITIILSYIFLIPTVRIAPQRSPYPDAYVPISSKLVQENTGLREALSCADASYEIAANSIGYQATAGCDMKITWFDAAKMKSDIPHSIYGYSIFTIEYDGKYYMIYVHPE